MGQIQLALLDQALKQHAEQGMFLGREVFEKTVLNQLIGRAVNQAATRTDSKQDATLIVCFKEKVSAGKRKSDETIPAGDVVFSIPICHSSRPQLPVFLGRNPPVPPGFLKTLTSGHVLYS
jgi:hypothetical protein